MLSRQEEMQQALTKSYQSALRRFPCNWVGLNSNRKTIPVAHYLPLAAITVNEMGGEECKVRERLEEVFPV